MGLSTVEIKKGIHWVGVVDWDLRYFHGPTYTTHRGTSYNSYLIMDEHVTLVDAVFAPFVGELIDNIRSLVDPSQIEYVVVNHIETDHAGGLPEIMKLAPKAKILCTGKAKAGLQKHFETDGWDFNVVKTGDTVSIGSRTLTFLEAPMLHWPDSMFTYIGEEELLMPNDAFGQHFASAFRFDDEVDPHILMEEAAKYYANILYPLSRMVLKKLEEVQAMNIPISMIAPSHGIIWRGDPGKIIKAYQRWASGEGEAKAVVVYETMWGSTSTMARAITDGLISEGIETRQYKMSSSDYSDIIREMLDARLVVIGSSTIHRHYLASLSPLLEEFNALKPVKRMGAAFGSHGWSKGAVGAIEESLKKAGIDVVQEGLEVLWVPDDEEKKRCFEWGQSLAASLK
jgi:anaerobic nitric oxide reductase flavorubredoxin